MDQNPVVTPTPVQTPNPAPAPAPGPRRKLSKAQVITLIVVGIVVILGLGVAVKQGMADNAIKKNGIETTAVSTGKYLQTREGGRRGHTVYKAHYTFEVNGNKQFVYGEKNFESPDEITEGKTVQVKYLKDEPHKSIVVSEE